MITHQDLASLSLFEDLTDDELDWLIANSTEQLLATGDYFIHEGEPADRFYVVLEGELQVIRTHNGRETVMGTTPRGIMGGELAILNGIPSSVTARAILPSRLMVLGLAAFRQMFAAAPPLGTRVLQTAAERMQNFAAFQKQQEKLAALGKLSAGLAHELNNPASAAQRAASSLRTALPVLQSRALRLCKLGMGAEQIDRLAAYQETLVARLGSLAPLSTIERSDREDTLGDWLAERDVPGAYDVAAALVELGVTAEELDGMIADLPLGAVAEALAWLAESAAADGLLREIELSSRRIAELVAAVKAYSYMDQGPVQEVDINRDLENTLTVLGHKLKKGVTVEREYAPALPRILGRGGELNQVWTNIIVNAIEAMGYKGTIRLTTRAEHDFVMVEIADDGPGIAPEILTRIFEPFFTTKGVGKGTGLGLDISYRIIKQHNGSIEVQSRPGHTRFIVRLPVGKSKA
ncbi:MAG: ATP-binding protein [Chloroflexi bacterium OHK40]